MAKGKILIANIKSGFMDFFKEIKERNRKIDMKSAIEECKAAKRYAAGDRRLKYINYHQLSKEGKNDCGEFLSDRSGGEGDIVGSKESYKDYCQLSKEGKIDCKYCSDKVKTFEIFYRGGLIKSLNRCLKEDKGLVSKV